MSRIMVLQCDGPRCVKHFTLSQMQYERRRVATIIAPELALPDDWIELHFCSAACEQAYAQGVGVTTTKGVDTSEETSKDSTPEISLNPGEAIVVHLHGARVLLDCTVECGYIFLNMPRDYQFNETPLFSGARPGTNQMHIKFKLPLAQES